MSHKKAKEFILFRFQLQFRGQRKLGDPYFIENYKLRLEQAMNKENQTFRIRNERIKELLSQDSCIDGATVAALGAAATAGVAVGAVAGIGVGLVAAGLVVVTCYVTNKVFECISLHWNKDDKMKIKMN